MWLEQVERSGRAEALRPSRLKEWLGPLGAAPPYLGLAGSCPHCSPRCTRAGRSGAAPPAGPGGGATGLIWERRAPSAGCPILSNPQPYPQLHPKAYN